MSANTPRRLETSRERREALTISAKTAGYSGLLFFGVHTIGVVLAGNASAAVIAQAVASEWGGGRLGIAWNDPRADAPDTRAMTMRALKGAALGFAIATLLVVLLVATRSATVSRGDFGTLSLVAGLLVAVCSAVRDEIVLRGALLRVLSNVRSPYVSIAAGGLAQVAMTIGLAETNVSLGQLLAASTLGALYTYLWLADRGAFVPVFAHAAFRYATTTLTAGALIDVRVGGSAWAGAEGGLLGGYAAAVAGFAGLSAARAIWKRVT